ncbi:hypothetical protein [Streptomyces sp. NPDC016675]
MRQLASLLGVSPATRPRVIHLLEPTRAS